MEAEPYALGSLMAGSAAEDPDDPIEELRQCSGTVVVRADDETIVLRHDFSALRSSQRVR